MGVSVGCAYRGRVLDGLARGKAGPSCTVSLIVAPFSEDNDKGWRVPTLQLTVCPSYTECVVVEQVSLRLTIEQLTLLADTLDESCIGREYVGDINANGGLRSNVSHPDDVG